MADAAYDAIANVKRGLHPKDIQYVVVNYHGEASVEAGGIGPVVSDLLGLHPVGVTQLCANCTGAGVSAHEAYGLVASGLYDRVLVVGFDKRWDLLNFADKRAIGGDVDYDFHNGFDHMHLQTLLQAMDFKKYGVRTVIETLVTFRLQLFWYGNRNPNAAVYGVPCPVASKKELMDIWELEPGSGRINPEFWKKIPMNYPVEGASAFIVVPADEAKALETGQAKPTISVNVWIEGPDSLIINQTAQYKLIMMGGPAIKGGFNVSSYFGTLNSIDTLVSLISVELTHSSPNPFSNDTVFWSFSYTAPDTLITDTLYSVGNSVNGDGDLGQLG